jgi:anaerobic ribonucleoside-triphosphate reductase activating protein
LRLDFLTRRQQDTVSVMLRLAHTVHSTQAEGPGKRFALWVQGCSLRCPGCCNPELFTSAGGQLVDPLELAQTVLATPDIEGISVLGGEPFEQAESLAPLCAAVRAGGRTVMVYTGYTLAELAQVHASSKLLAVTDLLLDGRYEATLPETTRRWVGSTNQVMHFLTDRYTPDDPQFAQANTAEVRLVGGKLTVNGWPALADALRRTR